MKVYLAAPWTHRPEARGAAAQLEDAGFTIAEAWWNHQDVTLGQHPDAHAILNEQARADIEGVRAADALVLLNYAKSEGKAVEQGIAIERGIPIVAVGERTNVFQGLPAYTWAATVEDAIRVLRSTAPASAPA